MNQYSVEQKTEDDKLKISAIKSNLKVFSLILINVTLSQL